MLRSSGHDFEAAYNADKHRIVTAYYLQTGSRGTSGRQETFAEAGARYLAGDSTLKDDLPAIHDYFEQRYRDEREFANTKAAAIHFRPTSVIYAHKGGYKSLTTTSKSIGTAISVEEFLANAAARTSAQ
ncbi:MAG: hypothetical protein ACRYF5_17660 [Janthinobacterium lividum]